MPRIRYFDEFVKRLRDCGEFRKHLTKETYFTRSSAKLTLPHLMTFLLTNNRKSAQIALNEFFRRLPQGKETMTKQSYFEAREKLSYTAFVQMNTDLVNMVENGAEGDEMRMYRGFRPIAVDGTALDIPPTAKKDFGYQITSGEAFPKARALAFVDVLNDFILRAQMDLYAKGERAITVEILDGYDAKPSDLFLFDRGFYSKDLAEKVTNTGASFVFRVKTRCQKAIDAAEHIDQEIFVGGLKLRVINIVLKNGEVEKLVTNIFEKSFTPDFFAKVYNMRWGVETTYSRLKERLEIENFSSGKKNLILQDFYASVVICNFTSLACFDTQELLDAEVKNKGLKHQRKPNMSLAFSEMRELLIASISGIVPLNQGLDELMAAIKKNPTPVRPGRSYPRKVKHLSAKFYLSKKRCI